MNARTSAPLITSRSRSAPARASICGQNVSTRSSATTTPSRISLDRSCLERRPSCRDQAATSSASSSRSSDSRAVTHDSRFPKDRATSRCDLPCETGYTISKKIVTALVDSCAQGIPSTDRASIVVFSAVAVLVDLGPRRVDSSEPVLPVPAELPPEVVDRAPPEPLQEEVPETAATVAATVAASLDDGLLPHFAEGI